MSDSYVFEQAAGVMHLTGREPTCVCDLLGLVHAEVS